MTGRLLLVRHGRTPWTDEGRLQGWASVGLSPSGREQVDDLGCRIAAGYSVDEVVSSPLRRAVATARTVARHSDPGAVRRDPDWRERSFGSYEGRRATVVFDEAPDLHPRKDGFDPTARPPDGESVVAVRDRVRRGWQSLRDRIHAGGLTVVLVTHTTPIRLLLGEREGLSVREALQSFDQQVGTYREIDPSSGSTGPSTENAP